MLSKKGWILAGLSALALAFLFQPLEARAQCGGGRTQMRTMMSTSPQTGTRGGSPQTYSLLSLLQQQTVVQAMLQQQQNVLQAGVQPLVQNAVKPVLKQQNNANPQPKLDVVQEQRIQDLAQVSGKQQLADLDTLKQKMAGR
jgi:hypothetical protein